MTESVALNGASLPERNATVATARKAAYTLVLLIIAVWLGRFNGVVFALATQAVKLALHLSDTDLGLLQGAAWNLSLGLAALPLGLAVDTTNRIRLITISVIGWSVCSGLMACCDSFWQLFLCRMGQGVFEAGLIPATYSLIADLFSARQRARANLSYLAATLFGASIGLAVAGAAFAWVADWKTSLPQALASLPVWRVTLLFAGLPGIGLGVLLLWVREPVRQNVHRDPAQPARESILRFLLANWLTISRLFLALVTVGLASDALVIWMPPILARDYGWTPTQAGEWLSICLGVGSLGGIAFAGTLTQILQRRWGPAALLRVLEIGALSAATTLILLLFTHTAAAILVVASAHFFCAFIAVATWPNLVVSIAPNTFRGRMFAIYNLVVMAGGLISPMLVGMFSDYLFSGNGSLWKAFCAGTIPIALLAPLALISIRKPLVRMMEKAT